VEDGRLVDVFVSCILPADDLCDLLFEILSCNISDGLLSKSLLPDLGVRHEFCDPKMPISPSTSLMGESHRMPKGPESLLKPWYGCNPSCRHSCSHIISRFSKDISLTSDYQ
jgi:hypothetical protein